MTQYPVPKFHFQVEWGGAKIGFTEITGLEVSTDVIEYRDGASLEYHKIKMPGMQKFANVIMKRGTFQGDNDYFEWWNTVALNTIVRRDLIISLLNETHDPVVVWKIKQAWPVKVEGPSLKSSGNEVAIESIELAHEGLTLENS